MRGEMLKQEEEGRRGKKGFTLYVASVVNLIITYLFSVNTFTPIERCAIVFVIAQVEKILDF